MSRVCQLLLLLFLANPFCGAQLSSLAAGTAVVQLPGPPQNPPIFSEMTVILQSGREQFLNGVDLKGPVAEVHREEIQSPNQNSNTDHKRTTLKFNDQGRRVIRIQEDSMGTQMITNTFRDGKLESQTVDYHSAKRGDWQDWERWSYDEHGRVSDVRSGHDKAERVHYLNFKYDAEGRPLRYEYSDAWWTMRTEISYSGKTVTTSTFDENRKLSERVQVVDDKGRVVDLKVSDLSDDQLKLWYHVAFKYDDKNRVIEQTTDPFKLGSGDDDSPIPGKLIVQYDDEKHWGDQKLYDKDGKLAFHARFQFDHDGIPTKFSYFDPSGKEITGSETFLDPKTHVANDRPGSVEWEVVYDGHDNWTERRRWFTPADGTQRIMTRLVRQTITYR